jgi:hypothetical protein
MNNEKAAAISVTILSIASLLRCGFGSFASLAVYAEKNNRNNKHDDDDNIRPIFLLAILAAVLLIYTSSLALSNPVYAQLIERVDPLTIERENGREHKIDIDFLAVTGDALEDGLVDINLDAKDRKFKLERGEHIEVRFKGTFGDVQSATASLFDGSVAVATDNTLVTGDLDFIDNEVVFFNQDLDPDTREFEASVPDNINKGKYKLIVKLDYDEAFEYFVTDVRVT